MVKIKKSEEKILDEKQEQKQETVIDHNVALKTFLDRVEIEDAIVYKNLRLFPINITEKKSTYKLMTLTEALKDNILEVEETDQVFRGDSHFSKNLNRIFKPQVLCSECRKKFKEFIKDGGDMPKACDACKEKLKDQMAESRYPDREI